MASADWRLVLLSVLLIRLLLFKRQISSLILGITVGAIVLLIHAHAISTSEIREYEDRTVRVEGVVASDPSRGTSRVIGSRILEPRSSLTMRVDFLVANGQGISMRIPIRVMTSGGVDVVPGDRVSISGRIAMTKESDVAALLIASGDISRSNDLSGMRSILERVRKDLREAAGKIGGDSGALLPGLAIGDTSLQSPEFSNLMRKAGLSHLTAVSGANFAIVSAFIFTLVGFAIPRLGPRILLTAIFLSLFVALVRPTPSVLRAAVMASVFLIARASGTKRIAASALASAVVVLLLINPYQGLEPGFILSVLATSGLIFLAPTLQEIFARRIPNWLAEIFAVATAASLFCTPYLMFFAGSVNFASILANVLVSPAVPLVTLLVFTASLLVLPLPAVAGFILKIANIGAEWIVAIAKAIEGAPTLSTSPFLALFLVLVAIYFFLSGSRKWLMGLAFLILIFNLTRVVFPSHEWQVAQCDIGQGDALLINLGNHSAALFDAGPDSELLSRCLREFDVRQLPLVVISHRHADHYNGLIGIGNRPVGEYWVNSDDPIFKGLTNVRIVDAGVRAEIGELKVESLWPDGSTKSFESIAGDGSVENNNSIVILAEIRGIKILVTGDIEPGVQEILARDYDLSEIDILKVPHHGSRFQDLAFLEEISPEVALISVGKNSYGHPNEGTVSALLQFGSKVFRSDKDGAIALSWQNGQGEPILSARKEGKEWWRIKWR